MNGAELDRALQIIERNHPRASLLYARIVLTLSNARGREMAQSDLSDRIGKGRDSSAVQGAIGRLAAMGLVKRDVGICPEFGCRQVQVRLTAPTAWPLH